MAKDKAIAIIQAGQTIDCILDKYGDFDSWFIQGMGTTKTQTRTYRVFEKIKFPEIENLAGIIITGSAAMVTDEMDWSENTIDWLKTVVDINIPILGVCYGHQLLAKLFGAKVGWNPLGRQIGQVKVSFNSNTQKDALFGEILSDFSKDLPLITTHQQSVIKLPPQLTRLATTVLDQNHCFRYKENVWGVQFHPEFSVEIIKEYIKVRSLDMIQEGLSPDKAKQALLENGWGRKILERFKHLCLHSKA